MAPKRPVDPKRAHYSDESHDAFMISFEDYGVDSLDAELVEGIVERAKLTGKYDRLINLCLLRDPFNLMASRFRGGWNTPDVLEEAIVKWKGYAREFLGDTDRLGHLLPVSFNTWFSDLNYRMKLADDLGVEFTDEGKGTLGHWGSSFDGKLYRDNADEMKVLDRWKNYDDQEWFLDLCSDPEVVELASRAFGFVPDCIRKQ